MSSVKKQEWLEYLIDTVEKEHDPSVQRFAPFFKVIIDDVKNKKTTCTQAIGYIKAVAPSIVEDSKEPHRIKKLIDGIVTFTQKIP